MELFSTGQIMMEELHQKAQALLPLLQQRVEGLKRVEVRRSLGWDDMEEVSVSTDSVDLELMGPVQTPDSVTLVDELADRPDLIQTSEQFTREQVLREVSLQLVCREGNDTLLAACPHVEVLDLAGLFWVPVQLTGKWKGMGRLQWTDLDALGLTVEELTAAAQENMARRQGVYVLLDDDMVQQFFQSGRWEGTPLEETRLDRQGYYIVHNRKNQGSRALILVPEVLEALEEKMGGPIFIAFTLMGELMILRDDGQRLQAEKTMLVLYLLKYWPCGFLDHLYRFDHIHGLQEVQAA